MIDAGQKLTLSKVSVRAIAAELGVSEMSVYRRTGGIEALRLLIADGIVARAEFSIPVREDLEEELAEVALRLRAFVHAHPGIGEHLLSIVPGANGTLERIEEAQALFAKRHGLSPAESSVLVSTVAEHAVALAAMNPSSHREQKNTEGIPADLRTIRAGSEAAGELSPTERFSWSMRATIRGALLLLGLPARDDRPLKVPGRESR